MTKEQLNVFLSPSNQTDNAYAYGSYTECGVMEDLANRIKTKLNAKGVKCTVMNRALVASIYDRTAYAKNNGATHFCPLHTNALNGTTRGCLTMYNPINPRNKTWAEILRSKTDALSPWSEIYSMWADSALVETRDVGAGMTSCFWEVEFHDVPVVAQWIVNNLDKLADVFIAALFQLENISDTGTTAPTSGFNSNDFVGIVAAKYEVNYPTGNGATISNTPGDWGGASYGVFQFATTQGTPKAFAIWLYDQLQTPTTLALKNATPGTSTFDNLWKQLDAELTDIEFIKWQIKYSAPKYYDPLNSKIIAECGVNCNTDRGLQELCWSTAIWFGPNTTVFSDAGVNSSMNAEQIINAVQQRKYDYIYQYKPNSSSLWGSLKARVLREKADYLNYVGKSGTDVNDIDNQNPDTASDEYKLYAGSGYINKEKVTGAVHCKIAAMTEIPNLSRSQVFLTDLESEATNKLDKFYGTFTQGTKNDNGDITKYKGRIKLDASIASFLGNGFVTINSLKIQYTRLQDKGKDTAIALKITSPYITTGTSVTKGQKGEIDITGTALQTYLKGTTNAILESNIDSEADYAQFTDIRILINSTIYIKVAT